VNFLDESMPVDFWTRCTPEPNSGCWLWTGAVDRHGYGKFRARWLAHRFAVSVVDQLSDTLTVDHKCRNTLCVNPAHLQQVTRRENTQLSQTRETSCGNGHEYTAENTRWFVGRLGFLNRACRKCDCDRAKRYQARKALS
jgi:hypothetical protein